jgi:hypothetical protein
MALAYVLDRLGKDPEIRLTNYGEYLELHPPEWEVEIHENSSWSCVHGVERWRSNCGCNTRCGWQQQWRKPLRLALDRLKEQLDDLFAVRGRECFPDPWAARDAYINVILDRGDASVLRFLEQYSQPGQGQKGIRTALWLLEMQRHGLLMYTSCGWFFDEISGLETAQCLRYAARAIQLARHFKQQLESEFVQALSRAPSNLPQFRNGQGVWEQLIHPGKVELNRVLAHYAMCSIYQSPQARARDYCFDLETLDHDMRSRGESHLAIGRLRVRLRLTWNEAETSFIVLHYGGLDFHTVLREGCSEEEYEAFKKKIVQAFAAGSLADVTQIVMQDFSGEERGIDDLFTEERRRIIGLVLRQRFEEYEQAFKRLADQDEATVNTLARLHYPIPKALKAAASTALDRRLNRALEHLTDGGSSAGIRQIVERGKAWNHQPTDPQALGHMLEKQLQAMVLGIRAESELSGLAARTKAILDAALLLGLTLDLWQVQNQLLRAYAALADTGPPSAAQQEVFVQLADWLNISRDMLGWQP